MGWNPLLTIIEDIDYIWGDYLVYKCNPCERTFKSRHALYEHCRHARVHRGSWCERCERLFETSIARESHEDNSSAHNLCWHCCLDYSTQEEYDRHMNDVHSQCLKCWTWRADSDDLMDHMVEEHHYCLLCQRYFENENNLWQHGRSHAPQCQKCYGCRRLFATVSAMLIHLESGVCESGADRDQLDNIVYSWYESEDYIHGWRYYHKYKCPDCQKTFRYLSGLFQHVESNACDQQLLGTSIGQLKDFISRSI